ncbi:Imidazolonepropionase [Dethiosulfatibacter aminovorans DSM 17477]|uniref:Imidazolonepropionase n=1 Tax=Dethiosulfatibacter aminovorans DSM 17477 TaxID=1121476 RepID=A0A1M6BL85_9FIRM|nr:amidohydrolase family protein [Dethiosulfatibacter aminovorans]SHI49273.1 Imidazolonepropionase [Dethiosulfatibacter aminovorans DSM 17477]
MLLLKNGKIFTLNNNKVIYGDILIDGGKIKAIDSNISSGEAKTVDLHQNIVLPGLIDASTSIGLIESASGVPGNDMNEKYEAAIPELKTLHGINPTDEYFEKAIASGVTSVIVNSGNSSVIGSQSCALKTSSSIREALLSDSIDIRCSLGDSPKKWNINKQETPLSRMGIINVLRENLYNATSYCNKKAKGEINLDNYSRKYESLIPVLERKLPLKIKADRIQDILSAIELKKEFNIDIILDGAAESYMAIEEIASNNIPVILGTCFTDNSSIELQNRRLDTAKILSENSVITSISTNHPDTVINMLLTSACLYVKEGMSYEHALRSVTINPSRTFGLDGRIGSLEPGKDADLAIFDGDPLKSMTRNIMTIIDGKIRFSR